MSDTNQERLKAVREAWKNERARVREGEGTRDWVQSEQREIMAKGRANGYEGHHMKSVKDYPQYAGDPNNIQFLNRNEHVNGAHRGNTQNATNGYYDPQAGTMHSFGNNAPQAPQSQALSAPVAQKQILALEREQAQKQAAQQAKTETKQDAEKFLVNNGQTQNPQNSPAENKGIESMRNKSLNNQPSPSQNVHSTNGGIKSYMDKSGTTQDSAASSNKGIQNFKDKANQSDSGSAANTHNTAKSESAGQSSGRGQES